jgi:hypothetical protein
MSNFPPSKWESFHLVHSSARFFKERRYLPLAFPELLRAEEPIHIVELGCGAGASILPILKVLIWLNFLSGWISPTT